MIGVWYFSSSPDGAVHLQARFEGAGGMLGDGYKRLKSGESFHGLSYRTLLAAEHGMVRVEGGKAKIVKDEEES